ncbi:hypothetical protein OHA21_15925 [Actinoplanes sp. NBC_00393]|uniref:hypothetical protein n=1 Tax=Actinoplanes sp. NBC_00393 TaxID=2975953 RepID=UPI002E1EB004
MPTHHRALSLAAPLLLVAYLLTVALVGLAVVSGRIQVQLMMWAYSPLPAIAFAVPTWTAYKWRRATAVTRRRELLRQIAVEIVISVVVVSTCIYQVMTVPDIYFTVL